MNIGVNHNSKDVLFFVQVRGCVLTLMFLFNFVMQVRGHCSGLISVA